MVKLDESFSAEWSTSTKSLPENFQLLLKSSFALLCRSRSLVIRINSKKERILEAKDLP